MIQNSNIPNVADIVDGWLCDMTAQITTTVITDGDAIESFSTAYFRGMIQVLNPTEIELKPEGERDWNWCKIYCDYANFECDDRIIIDSVYYRIMKKDFWQDLGYGYYAYDAIRDYQ